MRKAVNCRAITGIFALFLGILADSRLAAAQSCTVTQITNTTDTSRIGPGLAMSGDGTRVAIEAPFDLTGANADLNNEIFLYDTTTDTFTQITDTTGDISSNALPSLNGDGTRIGFVSDRDHTGENADEDFELFLYDTALEAFTQATSGDGIIFHDISADGSRLAFSAFGDLTGGNADESTEIFIYDVTTDTITQVTDSEVSFPFPEAHMNADGSLLVFEFDADLTGDNPDLNTEIFLYDVVAETFTQITDTINGYDNRVPDIDAAGTLISLSSEADLAGSNADHNRDVFLYDIADQTFTQITDTTAGFGILARMSDSGSHIIFDSFENFTGDNADGSLEVFLYDIEAETFTQVSRNQFISAPAAFPAVSADGSLVVYGSGAETVGDNTDHNLEYYLAVCDDGDSDDDGIPDDSDPDTVADVVVTLPLSDFRSGGNKNALLGRLNEIEGLILANNIAQAIQQLQDLRKRVDGCGATADKNDWIGNCASQVQVRQLIDGLIASLSA